MKAARKKEPVFRIRGTSTDDPPLDLVSPWLSEKDYGPVISEIITVNRKAFPDWELRVEYDDR